MKNSIYVLILCGGGGTRLWPRSRQKTPKQFINLLGEKTIFSQTMKRARSLAPEENIFIVTNADYVDEVYAQGKIPLRNIIAEPQKKNTALAMAAGSAVIEKYDPEGVIVNLASDHLISPLEKFTQDMLVAADVARRGHYLVTVGIKPNFPHTGFGYIHVDGELMRVKGKPVLKVKQFEEKPELTRAKKFVKSGNYYWNANLYTWKAREFLAACEAHSPKIFKGAKEIQAAWGTKDERRVMEKVYSEADDISVDYAVSEKAKNLVLLSASFDWSDVGDWEVVWEIMKKNNQGNVVVKFGERGEFLGTNSRNNLVQFNDQLIALVGVEDMIIINTADALLVCQKDRAQEVKKIVQLLKKKGRREYL